MGPTKGVRSIEQVIYRVRVVAIRPDSDNRIGYPSIPYI